MKFVAFLIVAITGVSGYENRKYLETTFKSSRRPYYNTHFVNWKRPYRESCQHLSQSFITNKPNYWDQSSTFLDEIPSFYSEEQGINNKFTYFPNQQQHVQNQPLSVKDQKPQLSFENQQQLPHRTPLQPFNINGQQYQNQQLLNKPQRQPLSFGGHSSYLKYGNHSLGFASVSITSTSPNSNELSSVTPTTISMMPSIHSPNAHLNEQSNTPRVPESTVAKFQTAYDLLKSKSNIEEHNMRTAVSSVNIPATRPLIVTLNELSGWKPVSAMQDATPAFIMTPSEFRKIPSDIDDVAIPACKRTGDRYNYISEESKGYSPFQESEPPEISSYVLRPQQINNP